MRAHHAFLAGFVGGLLLSTETLVVAVVFFALGAGVVFFSTQLVALFGWARGLLERRASSGGSSALEEPSSPSVFEKPPPSELEDWFGG